MIVPDEDVTKLIMFFNTNKGQFDAITQKTPYYHMGATITDAILQAGLNYKYVVYPRVRNLMVRFPQYKTTCDFIILFQTIPIGQLIEWKNVRKLQSIEDLSWLLQREEVQNEEQLSRWLCFEDNLEKLANVKGVGPKTIDYLKMLSGNKTVAIDRHLFGFLRLAGVFVNSYAEAHSIYIEAAKILDIDEHEIDQQIWAFMSSKFGNRLHSGLYINNTMC